MFDGSSLSKSQTAGTGDAALLVTDDGRLTTIDLSDPTRPTQVAVIQLFGEP